MGMDDYHILERIGEGSFGKVYRGRRKFSGNIVALKFVSKRGKSAKDLQSLRQEVRLLQSTLDTVTNDGPCICLCLMRSRAYHRLCMRTD